MIIVQLSDYALGRFAVFDPTDNCADQRCAADEAGSWLHSRESVIAFGHKEQPHKLRCRLGVRASARQPRRPSTMLVRLTTRSSASVKSREKKRSHCGYPSGFVGGGPFAES